MPSTNKAEVTAPSDTTIAVARDFDAPRSLVFLAFTKPELVRRWLLGPPGWTMPVCEIDLRVGGKYRYRWRSDAGDKQFGFTGIFTRIEPDTTLNHSERFEEAPDEGEAQIETSFRDRGSKTRVTYLMTFASKAARDAAAATGMTDGMEMSFRGLDKLLAAQAAG